MKPAATLPAITQAVVDELTAQLLPEMVKMLGDCLLITTNRTAGLLEMNSSSCKRLLIERGMLVNLGGNRGYRVSLASIRELIQERAVKNPRKAYIKKGNRNEA